MNTKTIFVLTSKGKDEVEHKTSLLFGDMKRALSMVDGNANFGDLSKRAAPSLRSVLSELFQELITGGFIEDKSKVGLGAKIKAPKPLGFIENSQGMSSELDFTTIMRAPTAEDMLVEAAKIQAAKELADTQQKQLASLAKAVQEAADVKVRAESEQRAKEQAEAARVKAEQEAKQRLEQEARAKQAADAAKLKAEQELARAKQEAELAKQKAEAEARARAESEQRAKEQAEAARVKAEQEAIRLKLQLEAQEVAIRLAAEQQASHNRAVALLLAQQQQATLQEMTLQQEAKVREEEQTRIKQHALSAMSSQLRNATSEVVDSHASTITLAAIDLSALSVEPVVAAEEASVQRAAELVAQEKQAARTAELEEQKEQEMRLLEQQEAQVTAAKKLAEQQLAQAQSVEAADAKKLADVQARAWAEAEQKAVSTAQSHADASIALHSASHSIHVARPPRTPLPWRGVAITLLVLLFMAIWLVPMVMPLQDYVVKLESQLSAKLQQPVHIGTMSARLLPSPRLVLNEIYVGEVKQVKAQRVVLNVGFAALFSDIKRIDSVELQEAELNVSGLLVVSAWFEKLAQDAQYPITRIVFERAKFSTPSLQFDDFMGEMTFSPAGSFASVSLHANAGKYALTVVRNESKLDATVSVHGSALPLLPNWVFDDLTAKGELSSNGFVVNDLDARIAGGSLQGSAKLDWSNGWSAQGSLTAKSLALASFSKLLEGDMSGVARFKMQANSLDKFADSAIFDGNFSAKKGVISGADIIETARLRSKENVPGGRTHFDEMNGNLNYVNNVYHFKQIKIKAGMLSANASADIVNRQLTGRVGASLSIQEGLSAVELQLSGNIDTPNLRAGR